MKNTLQQMQFKDRLCRTLLRVNWVIAIAVMLPVLSRIFVGVAFIGTALYLLVLIAITIMSLFFLLLNESFRALYNVDLNGLQELSDQIIAVYQSAMPVLIGVCAIVSAVLLLLILRNRDPAHKAGRIVSVSLAVLLLLIASLLYYIKLV